MRTGHCYCSTDQPRYKHFTKKNVAIVIFETYSPTLTREGTAGKKKHPQAISFYVCFLTRFFTCTCYSIFGDLNSLNQSFHLHIYILETLHA